jgi:glycosyltransferase involved in cell wall biosynthesis
MRIAIIAPPWVPVPPPAYGGTEAVLDSLARGLQAAGHDVLLYTTGDSTCPVPRAFVLPTAVGTDATTSATELQHVINAYGVIADWHPDVVHDHTLIGPVYADRYPFPVVTTNHGTFESELGDLYRALVGHVPVIAISHHQASTARDVTLAGVIHHGVDVDSFPMGDGRGGYALFLGRMNPTKGVHTAARLARAAGMPLKIAAKMAEPPELEYFHREVEPLLGDGVEYLGEVGGRAKLALLADAACLLNPIAWPEPFGMVMIEALACGVPVVAFRHGSVPEVIDDGVTGFVVESLEDAIAATRRVPTLDRRRCRAVFERRFDVSRMADDYLRLYEELLSRRRLASGAA